MENLRYYKKYLLTVSYFYWFCDNDKCIMWILLLTRSVFGDFDLCFSQKIKALCLWRHQHWIRPTLKLLSMKSSQVTAGMCSATLSSDEISDLLTDLFLMSPAIQKKVASRQVTRGSISAVTLSSTIGPSETEEKSRTCCKSS